MMPSTGTLPDFMSGMGSELSEPIFNITDFTETKTRKDHVHEGTHEQEISFTKRKTITTIKKEPAAETSSIAVGLLEEHFSQMFLETVYFLSGQSNHRYALDYIFQNISKLLLRGSAGLALCDRILTDADVTKMSSTLLVGFLSITLSASGFLLRRPFFYGNVYSKIAAERTPDIASRLLSKYNGR